MNTLEAPQPASRRLLSLDFLRGFIMVFLALESTRLYFELDYATKGTALNGLAKQFFHHPWHGLHFWDLIQPGFMFMAGVAMALSLQKQRQKGLSWGQSFKKTLRRCGWLFFWGVLNYLVHDDGVWFEFSNVLTQLSFTTLIAFLIFNWSFTAQLLVCVFFLLLREVLYRYTNIPGFDQPFVNQHNFGNYMELVLVGRINPEGWVSINCIPTVVHTIAGSLVGKLLLSDKNKIEPLLVWGVACLVVGYALDISGIDPIIKRIATSSFVIVSLGYCLLALALCYWWIDTMGHRNHLRFWTVVGMNSIFIYLFFEIVGSRWFNDYVFTITGSFMKLLNTPVVLSAIISSLCIFTLEWGLCYFLYRKKIFLRL